jgi:hypothetical protein
MGTKKGGFKKKLDSFHQTSWNFVGISTVVCSSYWGLKKFKMAAVAMVTKVQKMLNSLQTADPFPFWIFSTLNSCYTLRWIFLQSFMKFDERNPIFF